VRQGAVTADGQDYVSKEQWPSLSQKSQPRQRKKCLIMIVDLRLHKSETIQIYPRFHIHAVAEACKLDYVKPICIEGKEFADIPRWEIKTNIHRWSNTLVGYVLGDEPFYMALKGLCGNDLVPFMLSRDPLMRKWDFLFQIWRGI